VDYKILLIASPSYDDADFVTLVEWVRAGASHSSALGRLRREAQAASALNHPNICTIYDIGENEGEYFIAMEVLEGQTLRERISGKPLPLGLLLELGVQVADGLEAAHITSRGAAKILDFGLARKTRNKITETNSPDGEITLTLDEEHLTSPGEVLGTIAYMSPEQARGEELDTRTDIFSLGSVFTKWLQAGRRSRAVPLRCFLIRCYTIRQRRLQG
jgi:serine/threonine protein kinase